MVFCLGQGNEEMLTHCYKFTKQPLIICMTSDTQNQYFIKLDNNFIFCSNNFVNTIEIFFKLFWSFNLEYTSQALNFFYFFECLSNITVPNKPGLIELFRLISKC